MAAEGIMAVVVVGKEGIIAEGAMVASGGDISKGIVAKDIIGTAVGAAAE
jgi:hypothetical protein